MPQSGRVLAANLAANGHTLPADLAARAQRSVTYLNDGQAFALSEAAFGAGKGHSRVVGLVIGTGVGGGLVTDCRPVSGPTGMVGEIGHIAAPAHLVHLHGLPLHSCGCGRTGCIETLVSGAGIGRIAQAVMGRTATSQEIAANRAHDPDMARVWTVWCALAGELLHTLTLTLDPDCIVLGGGLSAIPGIMPDLAQAAQQAQLAGFTTAPLALAQGGPASGARGAAFAAAMAGA
jgi:predicted NBD/HSP70 family sugar kinase